MEYMKKLLLPVLAGLLLASCTYTKPIELQTGDLIFVCGQDEMDRAVSAATDVYNHVAIVERMGDSLLVIDATPSRGVARRSLDDFVNGLTDENKLMYPMRMTVAVDTAQVMKLAKALVGVRYDSAFLPDNDRIYCSELIQRCYLDKAGNPFFASRPMNFCDTTFTMQPYWEGWFASLGMDVPQNVMGTNPSDLFSDPRLKPVE